MADIARSKPPPGKAPPMPARSSLDDDEDTIVFDEDGPDVSRDPLLAATARLKRVAGVDAAFMDRSQLYVVTREHGDVDRAELLSIEDMLSDCGWDDITVAVRAHQGRDVDSVLPGLHRLF